MVNVLFKKFLVKMKNVSFIFTLKPKELFGQLNIRVGAWAV